MTYGEAFTFTQNATRTGYTFDGWYTDKTYTTEVRKGYTWKDTDTAPFTMLYTHWHHVSTPASDETVVYLIAARMGVLLVSLICLMFLSKHRKKM